MRGITFLFLILFLVSCNKFILKVSGYKMPKEIAQDKIIQFAKEKSLSIDKYYFVRDTFLYRALETRQTTDFIFGLNGEMYNTGAKAKKPECAANGVNFIKQYKKSGQYETLDNNWSREQAIWQTEDKKPVDFIPNNVYDLYVVYYWASFGEELSLKTKFDAIRNAIKSRPDLSICFIPVNIDLRKDVDYTYEERYFKKR
jgi:hypothetical protein